LPSNLVEAQSVAVAGLFSIALFNPPTRSRYCCFGHNDLKLALVLVKFSEKIGVVKANMKRMWENEA